MVKVLSKCQSSGPLLWRWMEARSTRVWQRVCGAVELPYGLDVECFLTALLKKKQSWAGLWAYSVSGTNKRGDSSHFTLDKQSEAVTNGRRSCGNSKTKMKERQLHRASLGPYRDCWVLCQTMTIISGLCCVKSSKSPPPLFLSLSPLSYAPGWIMQTKFSQSLYSSEYYQETCNGIKQERWVRPQISLF